MVNIGFLGGLKKEDESYEDPSERIAQQLVRFNNNFERYLDHLKVARPGVVVDYSPAVVEPRSEFELAIIEHAELTGKSLPGTNELD